MAALDHDCRFSGVPPAYSGCFCDAIAEPVVSVKFIAQKHYKDKRSQSLSNVQEKEGLKRGREEKDIDNEAPARPKYTGVVVL